MILGLGIDIVELARVRRAYERFGKLFLEKILSSEELANLPAQLLPWLGGRFAAKEAASKALGTGFSHGISPGDFCIYSDPFKKPELLFLGGAKIWADKLGVRHAHISISHEKLFAVAEVILED